MTTARLWLKPVIPLQVIRLQVIHFRVDGPPTPKQRARANPGGKAYYAPRARGSRRLSYTEYRELVRVECIKALGPGFRRPAEWDACQWALVVRAWLGPGDWDNVGGTVGDALQSGRTQDPLLWLDDKQITDAQVSLVRVGPREPRGILVEAWPLTEREILDKVGAWRRGDNV